MKPAEKIFHHMEAASSKYFATTALCKKKKQLVGLKLNLFINDNYKKTNKSATTV